MMDDHVFEEAFHEKDSRTERDQEQDDAMYAQRLGKQKGAAWGHKHRSPYSRKMARKGGQATVKPYSSQHFAHMGKKGGKTTKERQGPGFSRRIGKLGRAARRRWEEAGTPEKTNNHHP